MVKKKQTESKAEEVFIADHIVRGTSVSSGSIYYVGQHNKEFSRDIQEAKRLSTSMANDLVAKYELVLPSVKFASVPVAALNV